MGYCSRKYIREKYLKLKNDLENCLDVLNEDAPDKVEEDDIIRTIITIKDSSEAILNELRKGLDD